MNSKKSASKTVILGAGMTGLSAGYASGLPIYEAKDIAGGICTSYYMKKGSRERAYIMPKDEEAYHFEIGGGHWVFGGDAAVHRLMNALSPMKTYIRRSSVYLPQHDVFAAYPIQNNLKDLPKDLSQKALKEILADKKDAKVTTMGEWMKASFGETLCKIFFFPFHDLYTAGLWKTIAPQDGYKSPINKKDVQAGFDGKAGAVGYNATFVYPEKGLDHLTKKLAEKCDIRYGKAVKKIDIKKRVIEFVNGESLPYDEVISTLPLNKVMQMTGIKIDGDPYPSPAVLVINIGALRGPRCPKNDQWVYIPESKTGFHRVGFYDAVDTSFLPKSHRAKHDRASIYVEKAYPQGYKPTKKELEEVCQKTIEELQAWGWIGEVEAYDPTWIETAYTWAWPNSNWKERAVKELQKHGIYQIGRYGRWIFQGIADSIKDGLMIGAAFAKK
jgi:protoporphyrinogen oxidase